MRAESRRLSDALGACVAAMLVGTVLGACSSSSAGGTGDGGLYTMEGGNVGCTKGNVITDGKGHSLKTFCAPSAPGAGSMYVTASGETLSLSGFAYPPAEPPDDTYVIDGWNFQLEAYITVFTAVTVWSDPDESPSNQSLHGPQIAQVNGPWVVDLHKGGVLAGQGGMGEEATPISVITPAMLKDQCSTTRCAFGYSTIPAPPSYDAYNVNLTAEENAYYTYMVQGGYSVLYVGTATWKGDQPWSTAFPDCPMPSPECTQSKVTPPYDFTSKSGFPQTMKFMMGFNTPTNYVNCQNGSEFPGQFGIGGEDHPRGIQTSSTGSVPAQVTIHMDHPFWESFLEGSPLKWDPIAAQYIGKTDITVHTEDMKGVDFKAFVDSKGHPLPWRNCVGLCYMQPPGTQVSYDALTVPVCIGNEAEAAAGKCLADYYDYLRYSQTTQGHLNSQGFCFVDRRYPSPGGSSAP